ncbi:hypothetical protein ACFO1B_26965 [Dactylosporangium siamense]|uniref:Uncharacterized protein n=1 Tax=Dactylosporangium siamense TaxID=685454 RepID=A0A919PQR5_9ACTN|nr:hypothetical protein [Dactylosporangium siamense]GIG46658.1 hypothetical protein Dsi01nite_046990 [Dactylosporangium siamense]
MSNYIWFDGKQVAAGTRDIKVSGDAILDAFTRLTQGGSPITAIDSGTPGGNDSAGREFLKWYTEGKTALAKIGKDIGEAVVDMSKNTDLAVAAFVKEDLESADDMKKTAAEFKDI